MKERPALSIIIPVYNEEESVRLLYERIRDACDLMGKPYEVIFVDDGSRDRTFATLKEIHHWDRRVKAIRFRKNYGQTSAMAAGFRGARGGTVVSMDGDLQNNPADISHLLAKMEEGYDVVCGWRMNRQDKFWTRCLPSMAANWIIGRITGVRIHDNGCSLKAYRASVIKKTTLYGEMHRFIPAMSTLVGARIAEIPVSHYPRRFGKSKYGLGRIWRVILDIVTVKMITGFVSRPAHWFGMFSLPALLLGGIFLTGFVIGGTTGVVFPTLAFLCFSLAGHLTMMGILGEVILESGDFRPEEILAPMTIRDARFEDRESK